MKQVASEDMTVIELRETKIEHDSQLTGTAYQNMEERGRNDEDTVHYTGYPDIPGMKKTSE